MAPMTFRERTIFNERRSRVYVMSASTTACVAIDEKQTMGFLLLREKCHRAIVHSLFKASFQRAGDKVETRKQNSTTDGKGKQQHAKCLTKCRDVKYC
mmetsp:Transcript_556/g.741  ORF Transcript_556/g.741 Transcript_556/m.741 type:complete len:98 (-) Transcript_556:7-300(-)